ncbi:MAG TPA: HAMP domain-containing sensor histidine kinase [Gemmatimonadaceae bacterium]|nr:HAMP domain-containing sensor histidine kinase [Gemmatimonadaceae bacterium]
MSFSGGSSRTGLFALLLSVIVLSLLGSLLAADRALGIADREAARLDAHGVALVAERELRLRAAALGELFGPLLAASPQGSASDSAVVARFDAVWIMDGAGRRVWTNTVAGMPADSVVIGDLVASAARGGGASVRAAHGDSGRTAGLLLAVPLRHRDATLGTAIAAMSGRRFLGGLSDSAKHRSRLTLHASGRPLFAELRAGATTGQVTATAPVDFPGDSLVMEVEHPGSGRSLRTALWMLAVVAVIALFAGLWRERRQGLYLAGRTAELERLYQEVARSNRMKSEFLANVSHELRTPLNAVVGFVEMLREGVYGELTPRQALPVDRIAASATHLRHLVDRLLDIAKIAAGRLEVHPEPLVLRPFVLNVASEMESLVSERGLALSLSVGPTLPRIRTDQTHLRQILINLIGNAVKYTPTGSIQIKAQIVDGAPATPDAAASRTDVGTPPDPQRPWVALQVSDTGIGISPADTERIFDEFEQVNAGARTDSARRGTGLGLAISRRLARLLGGELTVTSEVGKGSVFTVWLPVDASDQRKTD